MSQETVANISNLVDENFERKKLLSSLAFKVF